MPQNLPASEPNAKKKRHCSSEQWFKRHGVKCENYAEANAVVADRGQMRACWGIVADDTGAEAQRYLATLGDGFQELVMQAAGVADERGRGWVWKARAIVAACVFFAYNCRPTDLHGQQAWRVAGFTMNFFRMLVSVERVFLNGEKIRQMVSRSTFGHVAKKRDSTAEPRGWLGELVKVGLIQGYQFDADKVQPHQRGRVNDQGQQWAFIQIFLMVRPFPAGLDGPAPLSKKKKPERGRTPGKTLLQKVRDAALRKAARQNKEAASHPSLEAADVVARVYAAPDPSPPVVSPPPAGLGGRGTPAYFHDRVARFIADKPPPA